MSGFTVLVVDDSRSIRTIIKNALGTLPRGIQIVEAGDGDSAVQLYKQHLADLVFMDRAQHTAADTLLESVQLGDIPGVGMVMIDGLIRCRRSRNTPPATEVPVVL